MVLAQPAWAQRNLVAPGLSPALSGVAPNFSSAHADVAASLPRHGGVKPPLRYAAFQDGATTPGGTNPGIAGSPAKPFTQEQVVSMVRDGFGDESGAKLIEQRGIDFAPSEDFYQTLKAAGASEAFLNALRAAKPPASPSVKKPLNQVQVFALLVGQVPSHRVTMLVQERGIDFEPTDDYLQEVRLAGGEDELISALKSAKVAKPVVTVDPAEKARQAEVQEHVAHGAQFTREKRYAEAEVEFRAAIRLDPQRSEPHYALGEALANKNSDWDGEIAEEREALRLDPNNVFAHIDLGVALGNKGRRDEEIFEEREAIRLDPSNYVAHYDLGLALSNKGDLNGAVAEDREALRLNPRDEGAHRNLGLALAVKGSNDEALPELREAVRLDPSDALAHGILGYVLGHKNNLDEAAAELRESLRLNPNNDFDHCYLGQVLGTKGDWEGADTEEHEALRLNPNNDMAHVNLGFVLAHKKDWNRAIAEYHEGLRLNPNNEFGHFFLGNALEKKGDWREALEEYRKACVLNPNNTAYRQSYERLLRHK